MKAQTLVAVALLLPALSACTGGRTDEAGLIADSREFSSRESCQESITLEWSGTMGAAASGNSVTASEDMQTLLLPEGCYFSTVTATISWEATGADLDMSMTAPTGETATSETGDLSSETVSLSGNLPGGDYNLRVYAYTSVDTSYTGVLRAEPGTPAAPGESPAPGSADIGAGFPVGSGSGVDDVVVVAVIDSGINPYHWDFLAEKMPQHGNTDAADNLPLDQDPATWIPGHPGAAAFKSYERLDLSVAAAGASPNAVPSELHAADQAEWDKINYSEGNTNADVNMYWVPGTKVIGHVAFSSAFGLVEPTTSNVVDGLIGPSTGPVDTFAFESHGIGSASVSVGNIHGTCPSCVLVYVHGPSEWANEWVASQDWIDLQTNSWGLSLTGGPVRDNIYAGSDTEKQRVGIERGQSWFQSAGNGLANAFTVPSSTLLSSQKGPDWIFTVGAIEPEGSSVGHNRPVDLSSVGAGYPSATGGGDSVTAEGNFSGTSNATPVTAGLYGEVLYRVRRLLNGPSRLQMGGAVAEGPAGCGAANAECPLADGTVTVHELQRALMHAAEYSAGGTTLLYQVGGPDIPDSENTAELEYVSEGHGSYYGRLLGDENYLADLTRIIDLVTGDAASDLTEEQRAWLVADSACRQSIWGSWDYGYYDGSNAPSADPNWPIRSFLSDICPATLPLVVEALEAYGSVTDPLNP